MDGSRFEHDLVAGFKAAGLRARQPRQDRPVDVGDIWVEDDVVVQAKAWVNVASAINAGLHGVVVQKKRAHRPIGVAIAKKAGEPLQNAIVAMPLHDFVLLLNSRQRPE